MHRVFRENSDKLDNTIFVDGEDYHHIKNVLRLKKSANIEVVIDGELYICEIEDIKDENIELQIVKKTEKDNNKDISIHIYQGLSKGDKFDFIIQKSVELGVTEITPLITSRVIVKLKDKNIDKKLDRYNKISKQAAAQSHRLTIPKVNYPIKLKDLELKENELGLVAYENSQEKNFKKTLIETDKSKIKVAVGPEGGFEEEEIDMLKERGFKVISLGPRILRTETAPLNILSIIQYEIGDLN